LVVLYHELDGPISDPTVLVDVRLGGLERVEVGVPDECQRPRERQDRVDFQAIGSIRRSRHHRERERRTQGKQMT
jgi:hypothetical protein